ncbi:ATP phosphoribosyltransferase regulatory subunit [Thiomicrorhabdus sp. ZW0627]|uniref:ATP phosphoribosyltransferase regulatory subunit n=1 Tax=Thiomicrorhabdus sp. ZW0627 TaxID=3039774 RepID=UPI002436E1B6|nr:ATP phosphoribosyltransferase regulatory subunit [Thiomicrorhabdus sp. ZW0627]MDG6773121.1 ATP phosphoribosyltransferase regulatory subunit [Thiomicrorhabdus sp. ZW0627]
MQQSSWFTPEGLEDLLPPQAQKLEFYRRKLIDGFHLSGYDLVLPPIAEFTDSLLTGTGLHRATDTCRFTDQESGRMMGVRSDMTPQVARIVSNRLKASEGISRLCYVGEVLKTRNNKAKGSRSPIQVGAELFGHQGVESDIEVIELMLESLSLISLPQLQLSLGHVGVVDELMSLANLSEEQQADLLDILKRKAIPEYQEWLAKTDMSAQIHTVFSGMLDLVGDAQTVISEAKKLFSGLESSVLDSALGHLEQIVSHILTTQDVSIHLDLADIRGYHYHTGVIFGCYSTGRQLQLIAKGGRYDGIGADFGMSLPATGFSLDLRTALDLLEPVEEIVKGRVYAPVSADMALKARVAELKNEGYQVISAYDGESVEEGAANLVFESGQWIVK